MGNVLVLQKWAQQLKAARDAVYDDQQWAMLGRFVMLEHPYKSSQLKLLELVAEEASFEFLQEDGESFVDMVLGDKEYPVEGPALVYLPQGKWSAEQEQEGENSKEISLFQRKLGDYLKRFASPQKIVFVTSGESYGEISTQLRTTGVLDRRFLVPRPSYAEIGNYFVEHVGRSLCDESLLENVDRAGVLLTVEFEDERRQGLAALGMQRIAYNESRKVTYDDLVHFGVRGSADIDLVPEVDETLLKRVAIHEAGHAIVAYLDSERTNIPEYISVLPGHQFRGVSVESYAHTGNVYGKQTYQDLRHKIRVLLAGRAAETLVLGRTKVGAYGSKSDLISASALAMDLVGSCGFSNDIDFVDCSSRNLLVLESDLSQTEQSRIEKMARKYLAYQYEKVEGLLGVGAGPLMMLSDNLIKKQVIFQREFEDVLTYNGF